MVCKAACAWLRIGAQDRGSEYHKPLQTATHNVTIMHGGSHMTHTLAHFVTAQPQVPAPPGAALGPLVPDFPVPKLARQHPSQAPKELRARHAWARQDAAHTTDTVPLRTGSSSLVHQTHAGMNTRIPRCGTRSRGRRRTIQSRCRSTRRQSAGSGPGPAAGLSARSSSADPARPPDPTRG
jgi:hypothetical protein